MSLLKIGFSVCHVKQNMHQSNRTGISSHSSESFELNERIVHIFVSIGKGDTAMHEFCMVVNKKCMGHNTLNAQSQALS
jgi:hypothetical protein